MHWHNLLHTLPRPGERLKLAGEVSLWALAVVWCVRTRTLMRRLGEVPDLTDVRWDLCPVQAPGLVIIVPARNEEDTIAPAMKTLLAQDYPWLRILAVDDRSTDTTGTLLDTLAAAHPDKLAVLHLTETAEGWIAKTFAMESAALRSRSEWILFLDADVWLSPSLLRRALAYAEMARVDHLVVAPTAVLLSWGETYVTAFLSVMALWGMRPWRVADPRARWDAVGAGAFNMIRREALEELGGLAPQRLAVVEDLTLGRRVRAAGMRQHLVFAPGLVLVHWATGALGILRGMTKNLFAVLSLRFWVAVAAAGGIIVLFLLPWIGLAWYRTTLPSAIILGCLGAQFLQLAPITGIPAAWGWTTPFGALAFLWALVRSVSVTLWQGGVRWRDTLYPLQELRPHNNPLSWELDARLADFDRRRRARPARGPRFLRVARPPREGRHAGRR